MKYNVETRTRETLSDTWAYNIQSNEYRVLNAGNNLNCEARKDHSMSHVGIHLVVYGGLNSKGHILDSLCIFNLGKFALVRLHRV